MSLKKELNYLNFYFVIKNSLSRLYVVLELVLFQSKMHLLYSMHLFIPPLNPINRQDFSERSSSFFNEIYV